MSNSRILNKPRQLNEDELVKLEQAQQKWYPAIFQTYNTSLYDMMASPYKKALLNAIFYIIILLGVFIANKKFNFIPFSDKVILIGMVAVLLFLCVPAAIGQYKTNDNIKLLFI